MLRTPIDPSTFAELIFSGATHGAGRSSLATRRLLLTFMAAVAAFVVLAPARASAALPADFIWKAPFTSSNDAAGFDVASSGDSGTCDRRVSAGAALYTWRASAGSSTRCYPSKLWDSGLSGFRMSGRFYVDVNPNELGPGNFLSLATFKLTGGADWPRVLTLNVRVDSKGSLAGKPRLDLYHTTSQGSGEQRQVRSLAIPLRQWFVVYVAVTPSGAISVRQDGAEVLTARLGSGEGTLYGAHWGGYASSGVTGWTLGNDDLIVQGYGAPVSAPVAALAVSPGVRPNQPVTFTDTSSNPRGNIASRAWDLDGDSRFDDGSAPSVVRAFPTGQRTVNVRVVADDGSQATAGVMLPVGVSAGSAPRAQLRPGGVIGFTPAVPQPEATLPASVGRIRVKASWTDGILELSIALPRRRARTAEIWAVHPKVPGGRPEPLLKFARIERISKTLIRAHLRVRTPVKVQSIYLKLNAKLANGRVHAGIRRTLLITRGTPTVVTVAEASARDPKKLLTP